MEGHDRFNVIAAFADEQDGLAALDTLASSGVPRAAMTVHRPDDGWAWQEVAELEAEMQDEVGESWGVLSGAQAKGAFAAALTLGVAGIALGLVAGLVWAYLFNSDFSRPGRVVLAAGVIGLAGATIGIVAGGARLRQEQDGEADGGCPRQMAAERDLLLTVASEDPATAERAARLLRWLGAERVHFFDVGGVPLPPQAQHPRPADPEGWWWRNAGHG